MDNKSIYKNASFLLCPCNYLPELLHDIFYWPFLTVYLRGNQSLPSRFISSSLTFLVVWHLIYEYLMLFQLVSDICPHLRQDDLQKTIKGYFTQIHWNIDFNHQDTQNWIETLNTQWVIELWEFENWL